MQNRKPILAGLPKAASMLLLLFPHAYALDISGKVIDKLWAPIAGASVCLQGNAAACAATAVDGTFKLTGTVSSLPGALPAQAVRFGTRNGRLILSSPQTGSAYLQWFVADGRSRFASGKLAIASGVNAVEAPQGMPAGMILWRLSLPGSISQWQGVWDGKAWLGAGPSRESGQAISARAGAPMAKAGAVAMLAISKTGFAGATYQPKAETETGDIIVLGGVGEKVSLMFDGKTLDGWLPSSGKLIGNADGSWVVKDGMLHSMGTVQGTLVSKADYGNFRMIFKMKQNAPSTHWASVLLFGTRTPTMHEFAIQAYQFGVPNGHHWDYFHTGNLAGDAYFTTTANSIDKFKPSLCEIVTNIATSEAKMACCNLNGGASCKTAEVLRFKHDGDARVAPIAFQIHNAGLLDDYWDITIEENPAVYEFVTAK